MSGGESSSTSNTLNSTPPWEHDVFLSFHGENTRLNFTDHLYEAFISSGITCFKDDVDLLSGKDIDYLLRVIQVSLCAVVVISRDFAKSTWCLDELETILESREILGGRVFPIFYNVNPDDVTNQKGSFEEALTELEEEFLENTTKVPYWTLSELEKKFEEITTKLQNWRTALSKIGNISGVDTRGKREAGIIKDIVGKVWSFVRPKLPSLDDDLVGIDTKVVDVISFLEIWLDDKRFVGVWGMGGVGKTTLAKAVFEKLKLLEKFQICCFLENVKDGDLVSLQRSLLSNLRMEKLEIADSYQGKQAIKHLLCNQKVLLVLDDIDNMSQLDDWTKNPDWFGKGSRIIITTRDLRMLCSFGEERIYKMEIMNNDESLQIFSKRAFHKNQPEEKYLEYSKSVVKYAGGLPLALKALGSHLERREEAVWREALDNLKQIDPHKNILQLLKISYDGLNENQQTIFLDIVCLFKRWSKKEVTQILKDLQPALGIKVLIERTLLVETTDGELDMHDLYEDLGRYIIQQKSPNSRLWKFGEIKEVLENNKGYEEIEVIVVENKYWIENQEAIEVHPEAFSKMSRLRLLFLNCHTKVPTGLQKLPDALKFVYWPSFPLEALPLPLDDLVYIQMRSSNMKQLWNGIKRMNHLKFIDLCGSCYLTETPDFSEVQSLEHLNLSKCLSLVSVESLGVLEKLVEVDLHYCSRLNFLPSKLDTNSLRRLDLSCCGNVEKLPEFGKDMDKLSYLDVSHTAISSLPESIGSLTGLRWLNLSCTGITSLPKSFRYLAGLRWLNLSCTGLINLPSDCFSVLLELLYLSLEGCKCLESLPRLPPRLIRLDASRCDSMKRSIDKQVLNLVTSLDHEYRGQTKYVISNEKEENILFKFRDVKVEPEDLPLRDFIALLSAIGGIPSWFNSKIEYYDKATHKCEIKVEIPSNFRPNEWSGIVVWLQGKNLRKIRWSSKRPEDDKYNKWEEWPHCCRNSSFDTFSLCIMVLEFNEKTCWQHLRGGNNSLHILFSSDDNDTYIWECAWRVICKKEIQKWRNDDDLNKLNQHQLASPVEIKLPLGIIFRVLGRLDLVY